MTNYSPHAHALLLNIAVMRHELARFMGLYLASHNTILIRRGLSTRLERCVLAHEVGHAVLGHTGTSPETEQEANRWAAALLVDPGKLERAREHFGDRRECYARVCDVSVEIMDAYLDAEAIIPCWREALLEEPFVRAAHRLDWSTMGPRTLNGRAVSDEGPIALSFARA